MSALEEYIDADAFMDSMDIAERTGNQHQSIVSLIKTHWKNLERFGSLKFIDWKSGGSGRPTRIYILNEPQATLLVIFLGNNEKVVNLKVELVFRLLGNLKSTN